MRRFSFPISLRVIIILLVALVNSGCEIGAPSPPAMTPYTTSIATPTSTTMATPTLIPTSRPSPSPRPTASPTSSTVTVTPVEAGQVLTTAVIELPAGPYFVWQCMPNPSMDWRPDGQALAYVEGGGVWLATAPDFTPKRLMERGIQPKWSPDGQCLATIWSEPERWVLQTIDLSGNVLQEIDLGFEKSLVIDRWLDNERLTLVIHRGAPGEVLHEANLTRKTTLPLVSPEGGTLSMLLGGRYYWSPDQKFLVVEWGFAVPPGLLTVIDVVRPDETHLAQFSEDRYQQFESWAPDSTKFLYEQWEGVSNAPLIEGNTSPSLFIWDVVEKRGRGVLSNVWGAAWSPKGDQIAFLLLGNPSKDEQGNITGTDFIPGQPFAISMGVMDTATYTVKALVPLGQVTDVEAFAAGPFWCGWPRPVWSPDSEQLVYWDADGNLWIMREDGTGQRQLTQGLEVKEVAWSPDGSLLAIATAGRLVIIETL